MTKQLELFHDSDSYEIYMFVKQTHKQFARLSNQEIINVKIRKLADKFFDDCHKVLYPDDESGYIQHCI